MSERENHSRHGSDNLPRGRRRRSSKASFVGALVLVPTLASAMTIALALPVGDADGAAGPQNRADVTGLVVVKRGEEKPAPGEPGGFFTGSTGVDRMFPAREPSRVAIASVTFEPGARTAWHSNRSARR